MPDPVDLFISIIFGLIGAGYFIYGKKQGKVVPLFSGIILSIYPYFVSNRIAMIAIGIALMALPAFLSIG